MSIKNVFYFELNKMELVPVENSKEHYHMCKVWLEDSEITKWLTSALRFGKYLRIIHERLILERKNKYLFIIDNDKPIGLAGFHNIDRVDKRAEIWFLIGSKADRRKNCAIQAVTLLKEIAKNDLQLVSLYALVAKPNTASIRVLEKNGFAYVGAFRKAFFLDGAYTDFLIFDWIY